MLKLIKSFIYAGAGVDAHRRRYIVNTNVFTLTVILITIPYPFMYQYLKVDMAWLAFVGSASFVLAYSVVIIFNYLELHLLAKLMFFLTGVAQLFAITVSFGKPAGLDQFFFGAMVLPFFIIDRHERILIYPVIFIFLLEYVLIQYLNIYIDPIMKLEKASAQIVNYATSAAVFFMLFVQSLYFYRGNLRAEAEIERERHLSEKLLLNVLPEPIASELKQNGVVKPVEFPSVTVVFTDFVGFTASSKNRNPAELLKDLDECFSAFDHIIEKYGLEKLKTIGDAYMFVGGIPEESKDHALRCVQAGLEIIEFVNQMQKARKKFWKIRVGVHTGKLVAGVIGKKKFIYDVWGDTVNTASRLESAGEPGKINIAEDTYRLIKKYYHCTPRGKISVKGKGPLNMYFVGEAI